MRDTESKVDVLGHLNLFAGAPARALRRGARLLDVASVPAGTALATQGQVPGQFFIVVDGRVGVRRDGIPVGELVPGDAFGAAALLAQRPTVADAVAVTAARLLVCDARCLQQLLDEVPVVARHLLEQSLDLAPQPPRARGGRTRRQPPRGALPRPRPAAIR